MLLVSALTRVPPDRAHQSFGSVALAIGRDCCLVALEPGGVEDGVVSGSVEIAAHPRRDDVLTIRVRFQILLAGDHRHIDHGLRLGIRADKSRNERCND